VISSVAPEDRGRIFHNGAGKKPQAPHVRASNGVRPRRDSQYKANPFLIEIGKVDWSDPASIGLSAFSPLRPQLILGGRHDGSS
jgi:hypothetical protein